MIIRAYELEKGHLFVKQGTLYLVVHKDEIDIIFKSCDKDNFNAGGEERTIGARSQERVELAEAGVVKDFQFNEKKKTKPHKKYPESKPINKAIRKADTLRLNTSSYF